MILRCVAGVAACLLLAAAAHAVITHAGGYGTPHSMITIALAIGVAVGAVAIGRAWQQRRRSVALALGLALVCGELFGLMSTAERLVAQREAAQSPIREAAERRADAARRVALAEEAAQRATTSDRLTKAENAKAAADLAARDKAAEKSCAANCRALLEQQVTAAGNEIAAARREVESNHAAALAAVRAARAELATTPAPPSAAPLADRLGLPPWAFDLLMAGVGSIAANGLAAALLVFSAHGAKSGHVQTQEAVAAPVEVCTPAPAIESPREHAARFAIECFAPAEGRVASLDDIRARYLDWCQSQSVAALTDAQLGRELAELFRRAGLEINSTGGRHVVIGLAVKPRALPLVA